MKTTGMKQQLEALRRMNGRDTFALFMEQGTGKTWTLLADAERLYAAGKIDGVIVITPKGVHTNWVRREIPTHMGVEVIARAWKSGAGKREMAKVEELLKPRERGEVTPLRVFAINIDALCTGAGISFAKRFMLSTRCMIVIDESSRIKTPTSRRTIAVMSLRRMAHYARIATGTPITNAPVDVFAQMEFLDHGLLGTTSYRAFVAEYADLMSEDHPMLKEMAKRNPKMKYAQMVLKNPDGSPRWRNLDKLQRLLEPHCYRVLKKDCLTLPDKIFKQVYFDLGAKQMAAYDLMENEYRVFLEDGTIESVSALSALMKLQQITSGYVNVEGVPMYVSKDNPRLEALEELLADAPEKFIIWARFKEEIRAIADLLKSKGIQAVEYHGGVSAAARELAVDSFQQGSARGFIGQPQSGGIGLTLTAAEWVVYYSNDFNLETRLQSEDRAHRIGTSKHVIYTDIVATDTIDEPIAKALQRKAHVAATILGDLR